MEEKLFAKEMREITEAAVEKAQQKYFTEVLQKIRKKAAKGEDTLCEVAYLLPPSAKAWFEEHGFSVEEQMSFNGCRLLMIQW